MEVSGPLQLLETDNVPGAKLDLKILATIPNYYKKNQLIRWLQCRGLPCSSNQNKEDLIRRIQKRVATGRSHILDVAIDGGKWLEEKRKRVLEEAGAQDGTQRPLLPITGWQNFPGHDIPSMFNEGDVYFWIVESVPQVLPDLLQIEEEVPQDDEEHQIPPGSKEAFRRGRRFIKSNYVLCVKDKDSQDLYFLKAEVLASMKREKRYVTATISKKSGSVLDASCTCTQRAMGRCSHVAAVLLYVSIWVDKHGYRAAACTSKPREWGKGRLQRDPGRIIEKNYYSRDIRRSSSFDPRPTASQINESFTEEELQNIHVAFQTTDVDSVLLKHIPINYYDEDIPDFDQLEEFQISDYDMGILDQKVKKFYTELDETVGADSDPYMIPNTEQQSESPTWKILRCLMVTASKAKTVLGLTSEVAKMNFLRRHLWGIGNITTRDMQYGMDNEGRAREAYIKWLNDPSTEVETTGLWVPKLQPYLGCSPDAVASKNGILRYIVEIKILKVLRKMKPKDFSIRLSKKQLQQFPVVRKNGRVKLKSTHSHYYQVHMSMDIMKVQLCHYVLWSPKGILVVKVPYDNIWWEPKRNELILRHTTLIATEYFVQRTPRKLYPLTVEWDEEEDDDSPV